jgi:prephenate dehydrogenase
LAVEPTHRRAAIVGTGLIGGSIGMALRAQGWAVSGVDNDEARAERAVQLGALDSVGIDPSVDLTFIAAPVEAIPAAARRALAETAGAVTDVGSVKASVVAAVSDPRFVGGHPMAGSEQLGVDGADPGLFQGAVWVLTPVDSTDSRAYALVRSVVATLGAEVLALPPQRHDALVAVVSHVPHLTAAALMGLAATGAEEHRTLLRLAAGGFRDMTRVAAGSPAIWPDICAQNRVAIVDVLDNLLAALTDVRGVVDKGDRHALLETLERAQSARLNLPSRVAQPGAMAEVRVPVPDRPGVLAEVTTLATDLGVNISDLEIAHSTEGSRGVIMMLVDVHQAEEFRRALLGRGYRPSVQGLA